MLAVRLREHHHLDVGRVAPDAREHVREVGDLAFREREPECSIDAREGASRIRAESDVTERAAWMRLEQAARLVGFQEQRLGHRVEERCRERREPLARQRPAGVESPGPAALDAANRPEPADVRDVGRLRRPGRNRARPRHGQQEIAGRLGCRGGIEVEQPLEDPAFPGCELARDVDEVDELGLDGADRGLDPPELGEQSLDPEAGECGCAPEP
jgi:hypothetical protein